MSTWIWQAGGDFLGDDGKQILFDQPEALSGLLAYLRLHRYVPPDIKKISWDVRDGYNLLANRRVAVAMGPCGWFEQIRELTRGTDLFTKLGVASPPGPSFVGGTNLIIWQHTRRVKEAVDIVTFLTSEQAQRHYGTKESRLPVRLDVLTEPPYTTGPHYQVMAEVLRTGRSYPALYRWGAVEERLAHVLIWLWNTLLTNPGIDAEALVKPYIEATARRLAVTLGIRQ
jgi:multiple sugar transport system substrate-binding protein